MVYLKRKREALASRLFFVMGRFSNRPLHLGGWAIFQSPPTLVRVGVVAAAAVPWRRLRRMDVSCWMMVSR